MGKAKVSQTLQTLKNKKTADYLYYKECLYYLEVCNSINFEILPLIFIFYFIFNLGIFLI